jgi:hypothetical protein
MPLGVILFSFGVLVIQLLYFVLWYDLQFCLKWTRLLYFVLHYDLTVILSQIPTFHVLPSWIMHGMGVLINNLGILVIVSDFFIRKDSIVASLVCFMNRKAFTY